MAFKSEVPIIGCSTLTALALTVLMLFSPLVWAQSLTVPAHANENQSFTVSWSGGGAYVHLQERIGNGSWTQVQQGSPSGSTQLSRPVGNYAYRISDCRQTGSTRNGPIFGCTPWSFQRNLVVTRPIVAPASLSASVNYATGRATLTWPSTTGPLSHYVIQQSRNGSWSHLNTSTTNSLQTAVLSSDSFRWRIRTCLSSVNVCSTFRTSSTHTPAVPSTPSLEALSSSSTTGNYTVRWNGVSRLGHYTLQENGTALPNTTSTSRSYSGKGTGNYSYRIMACNFLGCTNYSAARSITVTGQVQPAVAIEYEYDALGRLREVVVDGAVKTDYTYDDAGNRSRVTEY